MTWETKQLLIWGTTYPEFSKTYYETVCTGAVDLATGKLIRIYPIQLRYMNEPFHQYDVIEAQVERNTSDFRPESYKIRQDTIRVVESLRPAKDHWPRRSEIVLGERNVFRSVEALQAAQEADHTSLGLVRPKIVTRVYAQKRPDSEREEWDAKREAALVQRDLLVDAETQTQDLRFIPIRYKIEFRCDDEACTEDHDLSILDWGTYVLSRKMFAQGGDAHARSAVISKIEENFDCTKRTPYLFLGNTKAHCHLFSVVGFFSPPLVKEKERAAQMGLAL